MSSGSLDLEFFDASLVLLRLEKRQKTYAEFLKFKVEEQDWESVTNIACRLREIEAQIKVWERFTRGTDLI